MNNGMILQKSSSFMFALLIVGAGMCIGASTSGWYTASLQNQERVFETATSFRSGPIELLRINRNIESIDKGKAIKIGEKFNGGEDWLRGTTFKLKNHANRQIIYLDLEINFPETTSSGDEMSFSIVLGRRPNAKNQTKEPLLLDPGEEMSVTVDDLTYEKLERFLQPRHNTSSLSRARLNIGFVIFNDGIAWGAGNYYRQNPNNPNHYINIGEKPPND